MKKQEARDSYREKRRSLSITEREKMNDLLLIQFQSAELPFIQSLLTYWPIEENNEPNTHLLTEFMKFRNPELRVCYPITEFATSTMNAAVTDIDTPFIKKEHNLYEPQSNDILLPEHLDMVFVPLLAFDQQGFRVGYGKGFYDRFLPACSYDCLKIGFSYFGPMELISDRDEFDVPLDLCISPQDIYVF